MDDKFPLASLADRFIAFILDSGLFVVGYNFSFFFLYYGLGKSPSVLAQRALVAFWASSFCYYQAYSLSRCGQTLGKRLLGLKVVDADGNMPAFGAAFARALGYIASSTFLNLGFFWAFWDQSARGWHDLLAGTHVVEIRSKTTGQRRFLWTLALIIAGLLAAVQLRSWL